MRQYGTLVAHTRDVIIAFERLSGDFKSAHTYSQEFAGLEKEMYNQFYRDAQNIRPEVKQLRTLVSDNPQQVVRVDRLATLINENLDTLIKYSLSDLVARGQSWRLPQIFEVYKACDDGVAEEERLLAIRKSDRDKAIEVNRNISLIFSLLAICVIGYTFFSHIQANKKRKWLEDLLQSVLNTTQNAVVTFKAVRQGNNLHDFQILFANKATREVLEMDPKELKGYKLSELPGYFVGATTIARYIRVVETGKPEEYEMQYSKGATKKWFYVSLCKLEDGVTVTFQDITRLKQYEKELKKKISELEHSNNDLEQYAYVASHDLQEPLRKIRIFASQLQESSNLMNDKQNEYVEKIVSSAGRMSNLINDILNFSSLRLETGFEPTDLNEVIKNTLTDLELVIQQKQATISFNSLCEVDAIPLQMNQLFYNLVNNALKFTKDDVKPVVKIEAKNLTERDMRKHPELNPKVNYCEIVISDNGVGFDNSFSDQIFGLFKRLGNKESFPGSGIGLALCRKVVQNHNGLIFAEGKEGVGASFHIILPMQQVMENEKEVRANINVTASSV